LAETPLLILFRKAKNSAELHWRKSFTTDGTERTVQKRADFCNRSGGGAKRPGLDFDRDLSTNTSFYRFLCALSGLCDDYRRQRLLTADLATRFSHLTLDFPRRQRFSSPLRFSGLIMRSLPFLAVLASIIL